MSWAKEFRSLWLSTWGDWETHVTARFDNAACSDLMHISRLRIPTSLIEYVPQALHKHLRERVAWHQYHMLLGVTALRGQLSMPPRDHATTTASTSVSAWYSKLISRKVKPNPTPKVLKEQVLYAPRGFKLSAVKEQTSPKRYRNRCTDRYQCR